MLARSRGQSMTYRREAGVFRITRVQIAPAEDVVPRGLFRAILSRSESDISAIFSATRCSMSTRPLDGHDVVLLRAFPFPWRLLLQSAMARWRGE